MKNYTGIALTAGLLFLAGCADSTSDSIQQQARASEPIIELSEEEEALLMAPEEVPADSLEPVTSDNYEEMLQEMEDILNEDSE